MARATSDARTDAHAQGAAGKRLSPQLLRQAEKDPSILDSWKEGLHDGGHRQGDDDLAPPDVDEDEGDDEDEDSQEDGPVEPGGRAPRAKGSGQRRGRSAPRGRRRAGGRPALAAVPGARTAVSLAGGGLTGIIVGAVGYALALSVVDYGWEGPKYWFTAKFLNEVTVPSSGVTNPPKTAAPAKSGAGTFL